ncbi:hypothetical protein [Syntrophomonas palmitatica]|uniref:hypothetical protein n=1 Tax=Syntrophomonas palmitatica TaxID=402877 RepID=UPI0006D163B3|nr:hypothetical protein [Syntrophomonas palmitatica]
MKQRTKTLFVLIGLLFCLVMAGCQASPGGNKEMGERQSLQQTLPVLEQQNRTATSGLVVHFIDVGQGDSILVQTPAG